MAPSPQRSAPNYREVASEVCSTISSTSNSELDLG
jgi:hypothetical protein